LPNVLPIVASQLSGTIDFEKPANKPQVPAMDVVPSVSSFEEAGISAEIIAAAAKNGWTNPTPVQGMCLPLTVQGRDVAGFAQTGTGKTAVFILTVAQRMHLQPPPVSERPDVAVPEVVVLTPTRELTMQIDEDAKKILEPLQINSMAVFGGVDFEKQATKLKSAPRMIVATPGRLKDFFQRKMVDLSQVKIFICDEADRMFDMGFIDDVEFFLDKIPEGAQKLLFSATTNDKVKELAFEYLNQPAYISVNPEVITPENIDQHAVICDAGNKLRVMLGLLQDHQPECAIIFVNTKMVADWLQFKLAGNGIDVDLITGDLPQSKRIALIQRIKLGKVKALIATDVASRGLHISKVSHVYNFDVPEDPSNYVHRIGRTARAGSYGKSYTLVCDDYGENMIAINDMLGPDIAPKTEWFDKKYLDIKDLTGNPYEVDGPLYRNPKDRDDRRKGAFAKDDRGSKGKFESRSQGNVGAKRNDSREDKPGKDRHQPQRGSKQFAKSDKPYHRPKLTGRSAEGNNAIAPVQGSISLFGWIKNLFAKIFGK
jgi:ATP-dependent RNA helicase RhlB